MTSSKTALRMALMIAAMGGSLTRGYRGDGPYRSAIPEPMSRNEVDRIKQRIIEERVVNARKKRKGRSCK